MPKTVGVAVSNATFHFDKLYTYAVMPDQQEAVRLGSMVLVPFGRGSKARMGVVLACDEEPEHAKLKYLFDVAPASACLTPELLRLVHFLKERTFCTYYEAVKAVIPYGAQYKPALAADGVTPVLQKQLTRHTENSYKLVGALQQKPRPTAKQLAAVALLSGGERTQNEMEAHGITKAVLDNLCAKGVVECSKVNKSIDLYSSIPLKNEPITLTAEQQAAYDALLPGLEDTAPHSALLYGVTGSGKTLTSFKTARLASQLPYIDKVLFVVDRKDLDYQTMKEYDRFEKGAANSNTSTTILKRQLENPEAHIIITTIQKLATFIKKNPGHEVYQKHVVIIFDECHRSQFGDMHGAIVHNFKKYYLFGFTGTPIYAANAGTSGKPGMRTTPQLFGGEPNEKGEKVLPLHTYTIVDAINDKNVLPFRVDYIKTMDAEPDMDDKQVWDIDREKAFMAPKRISLVTKYILDHFDQKTYRGDKSYEFNLLTNVAEVASAQRGAVEEIKQKQRVSGFNSIFCVASVPMAKLYYQEFKKQMAADPTKRLRIATIYSYGANEAETDGILDEENPEDTSNLDQSSRDFLDAAIQDYNEMFHTNYSTDGERFQNYYKDVSLRMKNKELDLLIVVNMFLTGFDATTLNTLWVDKNLKMHGLIQAFSRTNRILNSIKTFGNIVCFRNLQKRVDAAISLFGDKNAGGIVLLRKYADYYHGYTDEQGKYHQGYTDMIDDLTQKFPLTEPQIIGEQNQKDFIVLFGALLRMRNLLSSFDDFKGNELISERDLQDYLGRYQDLRDEWRNKKHDETKEDITDDVVFEVELIRQVEINIDYILMLVKKYHDTHCDDKEVLITIRKAIDASPELRSKKQLIETFIAGVNDVDDVMAEWNTYVSEQREKELAKIIQEEKLKEPETRKYLANAFRDGEIKTVGTDIDKLMPPVSRFGGGGRAQKKQGVIDKLKSFFDKFFGIGGSSMAGDDSK